MDHKELCLSAARWLGKQGCGVVFDERLRAYCITGERPDVIGWRDGLSILIEVKTSRNDFHSDKKKAFRIDAAQGMGDWRFYLCPPGIISVSDLPSGWGLLYAHDKTISKIHGVPLNTEWWKKKPFEGNKRAETQLMYSALRRLNLKGRLKEIYMEMLDKESAF